jgi:hypothetical protein
MMMCNVLRREIENPSPIRLAGSGQEKLPGSNFVAHVFVSG